VETAKKKAVLEKINLEFSKHAAQLGQKMWLLKKYGQELGEHKAKMSELDARAQKLHTEIQESASV
jgi:chromosome segregation ATPase